MKTNVYKVATLGLLFVLGVIGGYFFIVFKRRSTNQVIAYILQGGASASAFARPTRDAINLFAQINQIPVRRFVPDGSAADSLRIFEKIYAEGIRKVVGPLTSGEIDEKVQQFIADHPDMIVITPSATNPAIGTKIHMPNFFRFVAPDDVLAKMYVPFMLTRVHNLKNLIILSRDDLWGKSLTSIIEQNVREKAVHVTVNSFFYTIPEKFVNNEEFSRYLSGVVARIREELKKVNGPTAIMLNTFSEISQYVYLVNKDPLFIVPHFGSDSLVYSGIPFEDTVIAKFLSDVKFEILAYFADNALSTKRFEIAEQFLLQQKKYNIPLLMPSLYAFTAYDAMSCLALCDTPADMKKVLDDFYGACGFIELDERNNRCRGNFLGVGVVFDGSTYRWMPLSLSKYEVYFDKLGILAHTFVDLSASYEISWDKSWNVEVELIGFDLTDKPRFKPEGNTFNAQVGAYVVLYCRNGELDLKFMVYPALTTEGTQVYVNLSTRDQWVKQTTDSLYLAEKADYLVIKKHENKSSATAMSGGGGGIEMKKTNI